MFHVEINTPEGIKSVADFSKNVPEKLVNAAEFTQDQIDEFLSHIKTNWSGKKHQKDTVIVKEFDTTKIIGKWRSFAVGGYGYGGIIYVFDVLRI